MSPLHEKSHLIRNEDIWNLDVYRLFPTLADCCFVLIALLLGLARIKILAPR